MPVSDSTGWPEPKYFRLWEQITDGLHPGEKLSNGKPKPDMVYRKAEGALQTLASQWQERYEYITDQDRAKHQVARRWVQAVNNWGQMGQKVAIAEDFFEGLRANPTPPAKV